MLSVTRSLLVSLVGGEEGRVDWFHARRASEATHQPVVYALDMVSVHTGQVAYTVPHD